MGEYFRKATKFILPPLIVFILLWCFISTLHKNEALQDTILQLVEELPFGKEFAQLIINKKKFENNVPLFSWEDFLKNILKLLVMICLRKPVVIGFYKLFSIFSGKSDSAEEKIGIFKELIISIIIAPGLAFIIAYVTEMLTESFKLKFGGGWFIVLIIFLIAAAFFLSLLTLTIGTAGAVGLSFGNALRWRFGVTFIGETVYNLFITAGSLFVCKALISGDSNQLLLSILSFILLLGIIDFGIKNLQYALVGSFK